MEACPGLANELASGNWPLPAGNEMAITCQEEEGHDAQGDKACPRCAEVEECSGVQDCFCELAPVMWGEGEPAVTKFLELPQHTTDFLSSVPPHRPLVELPLLPKYQRKDKTLVLDLDQTLVHSTLTTMNQPSRLTMSRLEQEGGVEEPAGQSPCQDQKGGQEAQSEVKELQLLRQKMLELEQERRRLLEKNKQLEDTALLRMEEFLVKLAQAKDARQAVHDYYDQL